MVLATGMGVFLPYLKAISKTRIASRRFVYTKAVSGHLPFSDAHMAVAAAVENGSGNLFDRQLDLGGAERVCRLRHAIDDAGRLVLADGGGAGRAHLLQTLGTVLAHAGKDNADGIAPGARRDRAEQHVHRRAVAGDRRTIAEAAGIVSAGAHDFEVP